MILSILTWKVFPNPMICTTWQRIASGASNILPQQTCKLTVCNRPQEPKRIITKTIRMHKKQKWYKIIKSYWESGLLNVIMWSPRQQAGSHLGYADCSLILNVLVNPRTITLHNFSTCELQEKPLHCSYFLSNGNWNINHEALKVNWAFGRVFPEIRRKTLNQ